MIDLFVLVRNVKKSIRYLYFKHFFQYYNFNKNH